AGVLHGAKSYLLHDEDGQILPAHSVSAGLDYPGVGPEHSWLKDSGRAEYVAVTDEEAQEACRLLSRLEGIVPALESAASVGQAVRVAARLARNDVGRVSLSGRGDKDVQHVAALMGGREEARARTFAQAPARRRRRLSSPRPRGGRR